MTEGPPEGVSEALSTLKQRDITVMKVAAMDQVRMAPQCVCYTMNTPILSVSDSMKVISHLETRAERRPYFARVQRSPVTSVMKAIPAGWRLISRPREYLPEDGAKQEEVIT
jgi:hypothetical protein